MSRVLIPRPVSVSVQQTQFMKRCKSETSQNGKWSNGDDVLLFVVSSVTTDNRIVFFFSM